MVLRLVSGVSRGRSRFDTIWWAKWLRNRVFSE